MSRTCLFIFGSVNANKRHWYRAGQNLKQKVVIRFSDIQKGSGSR
jgi:hypothetical protein